MLILSIATIICIVFILIACVMNDNEILQLIGGFCFASLLLIVFLGWGAFGCMYPMKNTYTVIPSTEYEYIATKKYSICIYKKYELKTDTISDRDILKTHPNIYLHRAYNMYGGMIADELKLEKEE